LLAAGLPDATEGGDAILPARTAGLFTAEPPRALEGADVTVVAATTGLSGARPPGDDEDGGGTMAAGNVGLAGAGGGGITVVASTTGLSCAGPVGGIGPFPLRSGIAAGFSTGGATWMSGVGFGFGAVSFRRRLGKAAAERGAFAFPRRGAAFMMSSGGNGLPRRGTPRGSSQIHFTAPLPPSVRMKLFFSRRCISSITQRFEKPVSLARSAISIWRPPTLGASGLGDASNWINARHRVASAGGMTFNSHWRSISPDMSAGLDQVIGLGLVRFTGLGEESFKEIRSFHMQQWTRFFAPPPADSLIRRCRPLRHFDLDDLGRPRPFGRPRRLLCQRDLLRRRWLQKHAVAVGERAALLQAQDQVEFVEAGDGLADGAGTEAGVFLDLGDGIREGFLVPSAAPGLVPAQDQQDFEFGAMEAGKMLEDCERHPDTAGLGRGGSPDRGIGIRVHDDIIGRLGMAL
jgi:hypothetical protein